MAMKEKQEQQGRKRNNNNQNNQQMFNSDIKGMQNHTFDCVDSNFVDKFRNSLEELAKYVHNTQYYDSPNIGALIQAMYILEFVVPEADE